MRLCLSMECALCGAAEVEFVGIGAYLVGVGGVSGVDVSADGIRVGVGVDVRGGFVVGCWCWLLAVGCWCILVFDGVGVGVIGYKGWWCWTLCYWRWFCYWSFVLLLLFGDVGGVFVFVMAPLVLFSLLSVLR